MSEIDENKYSFIPCTDDLREELKPRLVKDAGLTKFLSSEISKNASLVCYDNNIIGFYSVKGYPDGELQLGIFEEYRGSGHGKKLTVKITNDCFNKENYHSIYLLCRPDNVISQKSALASGFRRDYDKEMMAGDRELPYITYFKVNYNYDRSRGR